MQSPSNDSSKSTIFLIIDLYTADNRGDAAILKGLLCSLKQEAPASQFIIHTWFPDSVEQSPHLTIRRSLITHFIGNYRDTFQTVVVCLTFIFCSLLVGLKINISLVLPKKYQTAFSDFLQADVIVGMGGGFYNDNYWQALPSRLCHLLIGKLLRKPVVISAHSFGPFRRKIFQIVARFTFNIVDALCVRDTTSLQTLQTLKIPTSKIHKVADSAWLLDGISEEETRRLLKEQKIDLSQPRLISLSARQWYYYRTVESHLGHIRYVNALTKALDIIIETYQAFIVYLSTCDDDRRIGLEIQSGLEHPEKFHIVSGDYTPMQLKGMYGMMDMHLGTRMHSVILALSAGTPCLGISYEPKLLSLMKEIGLQDYVIDVEDVDWHTIVKGTERILANYDYLITIIQREVPRLQRLAQENANIITQFVRH